MARLRAKVPPTQCTVCVNVRGGSLGTFTSRKVRGRFSTGMKASAFSGMNLSLVVVCTLTERQKRSATILTARGFGCA